MEELLKKMGEAKTPLQYDNFRKYYIENKELENCTCGWKNGTHQWLFKFENGYGASVIKHYGSYGFEDDLFELAVIKFNNHPSKLYGNNWHLVFDTPITNDVIGYLTNNDVLRYLRKIQGLEKNDG